MLNQALMALGTGSQTEAVFPQLNRCLVAIVETVDQLSAHDGSVGMEPKSVVVK